MSRTLFIVLACGCAPTLSPSDAGSSDAAWSRADASIPPVSGAFRHEVSADGVVTTVVDATDGAAWRHLDLETGAQVDPGTSSEWDLAFSRFRVRTNGGVSGTGGVQVAALEGQPFEALTRAPEEGWSVDRPDGDDDDTEPDNVFNNGVSDWFAYDPETHTLAPRDVTYAIASGADRFYKLRFESYYDDAGSPALVRFRSAEIAAPASSLPDAGTLDRLDGGVMPDAGEEPLPPGAIVVDASDSAAWVYLSVAEGLVTPSDPESDLGWDLAFRRTEIRTSSGTSGAGFGGARAYEGELAFDAMTDATTFGYSVDDLVRSGRPGAEPTSVSPVLAGWYDYDPAAHRVTPGDRTYLVRTARGGYAKLRVWRWRDGEYALSLASIARRVDVVELDVDASSSDAWVYVSLRDGAPVAVTDAAADAVWDLGISRTRMRTNGGTSGTAMGAAAETAAAEMVDLAEAPDGWTSDAMLTEGPPGTPAFSGNPVLAGWYDYDPLSHTVSARPIVFAIRTADGHVAALRVRAYAGGVYRIALAYAGPGQDRF